MSVKLRNGIGFSAAALALPLVLLAAACDQQPASKDAPSPHAQPDLVVQPPAAAPPPAAEPAPPAAEEASDVRAAPRTPPPVARPVRVGANPSFDCARATRNVERMICGDGELAAADRALSAAVARAGRFSILRDDLRSGGRAFLARRDRCPDRDCVLDEYSRWTTDVQGMAKEQQMIG
jgi:hypothetical protein